MNVEYLRAYDGPAPRELVMFYHDDVQDEPASLKEGRPIFRQIEMLEIRFPGNNLTVINRKVKPEDRAEYAKQYEAFKATGAQLVVGTPLHAWPALSRSQVKEFQALNIMSVEMLAAIDDNGIQRIGMGGRLWRDRAKVFLEAAKDAGVADKLAADKALLQEQLDTANRQIGDLGGAVRSLQGQVAQLLAGGAAPLAAPMPVAPPAPMQPSALAADSGYVAPQRMAKKA